jgi:DNA-binding response OmpR family regulator
VNILFLKTNECIKEELRECISDLPGNTYFADTIEEAVAMLHTYPIDIAFLDVQYLADIQFVKYAHTHFKHIQIILSVESTLEDVISIIRSSQFSVLHRPFTLKEVRAILEARNVPEEAV